MTASVRESLIRDLKGKTIRIPDLGHSMSGWPQRLNPEFGDLRNRVEVTLDRYDLLFSISTCSHLLSPNTSFSAI